MSTLADLLTSKIPPHSLEAERAVLGALLLDAAALAPTGDLTDTDFYKEGHRTIFGAIRRCAADQGADLVTVSEALRQAAQLDAIGGPAALGQLVEEAALLTRLPAYCAIVREHATRRELIRCSTQVIGQAYEAGSTAIEILGTAARTLEQLALRAAPPAAAFPAMPIATLLAADIPDPTFHVHGWIPATGVTFIVGDSEAYKSWFALLLAVSVAAGRPFFDRFPVTQAPTLLISEENGDLEDKRRLALLCRGLGLDPAAVPCHIAPDTSFSFDDPAKLAGLRAYVEAHGIRLVLIDSFVRVHRRKENDAGEMSALYMDRMKPLIQAGVALCLLHHRRKTQPGPQPTTQPGGADSDEIRGSGDLRAATHAVLFLRTVSDTQVLVKHNKTRGFKRQDPFVFAMADIDEGGVVLTWEGRPEDALDKTGGCREAILLYAAQKKAFSRKDLQVELKGRFGRKVYEPVLKALSDAGTPLRLELRGSRHSAWYVYVPQGPDGGPAPDEDAQMDVPF